MYTTDIITKEISAADLYDLYCNPEKFLPFCKECPDYSRVWSCPPGVPNSKVFEKYRYATIIGVKVSYSESARKAAEKSPEDTEKVRADTYGRVKHKVLNALLKAEKLTTPSYTIAAGRCEICERCARMDGLVCRNPLALRYSFSAYGFDLGRISQELLNIPLVWANKGLPQYNMAIYAFLTNEKTLPELNLSEE